MMALLVLAVALPTVSAFTVLRLLAPERARDPATLALRTGLALVMGQGAGSLVAYGWLCAGGALHGTFVFVDAAVFALVLVAALWAHPLSSADSGAAPRRVRTPLDVIAIAMVVVSVALVAAALASDVSLAPHGDWDAWAIWNLRARFLSRGGDAWRIAFSPPFGWSNPGYPLLVPATVARLWAYAGETVTAPAVAAAIFTVAPLLVLFGAVGRRAGLAAGASAALLLAGTEEWFFWGASQGADVAVSAYVVAGAAALIEAAEAEGRRRAVYLVLAGALLGLAGWTKDEGLMFAAVLGVWGLVRGRRAEFGARAAALAAGLFIPAVARLHFQLTIAPGLATALTDGGNGTTLGRVLDPGRWSTILSTVPGHVPGLGRWLPLVAVVLAFILGARPRHVPKSMLVPVAASYAAFLLVYAATPLPLAYHITTSAPRVLLQPWPVLLLGVFAIVPGPALAGQARQEQSRPRGRRRRRAA